MNKCRHCGKPGQVFDLQHEGTQVGQGCLCESCFNTAMVGYRQMQRYFERLLEQGCHRKIANARMEVLMDRGEKPWETP